MKFLDLNGLTSVLSKLLTKVSTAFDGLEERVTANETAIEGKADEEHSQEDVNELIKRLYVNNYDGVLVEISPDTSTFQPKLDEFETKITA